MDVNDKAIQVSQVFSGMKAVIRGKTSLTLDRMQTIKAYRDKRRLFQATQTDEKYGNYQYFVGTVYTMIVDPSQALIGINKVD